MTFLKQWRFWLSLLLVGFCFYFIQPNFNSKNSDFKINFGLDIQGGYSYLLELNENEFKQNLLKSNFSLTRYKTTHCRSHICHST